MKETKPHQIQKTFVRLFNLNSILLMIVFAATAFGCAWSMFTDHSVRFNGFRSGRGFYRLPPLPIMLEPKTGKEITVQSLNDHDEPFETGYESETENAESVGVKIWDETRMAVQANDLAKARDGLEKFLDLTKVPQFEEPDHERRNSARDMLDALEALKHGSKAESVREYLDARYAAYHNNGESLDESLGRASADRNLQDNWDYLRAALLVRDKKMDEALLAFEEQSAKHPASEKHEAVLYMIAKLTMESSHSFGNAACGIHGKDASGQPIDTSGAEPIEECRDENWVKAIELFQKLMRLYPSGRYFNDARGWLAYLYRRGGERAKSLAEYYRMLGHPTDWNVRLEAKKSLQIIGHEYDDATLDEVEKLIADDQNAAMAYAYHRIYNHAIDLTYVELNQWVMREDDWAVAQEEKKRVSDAHGAGSHELERVARFATTMLNRHPGARVSGAFLLRVAESQLELQNFAEALKLAKKALGSGIEGDLRTEALWIKGSAEHAARDFKSAHTTFAALIREYPKSKLTEGARRLLAMITEDQDDLETALEQYLALGYKYDVAYFVDVLMPTDRLARFVDSHRSDPSYNKFLYSIGLRYMREKRWDEARIALRKVVTRDDQPATGWDLYTNRLQRVFAKSPEDHTVLGDVIKTGWVMQDMKTIDAMENFELAIASAPDDEARAEVMYQLASFQFDADELLFYNPSLWKGARHLLLSELNYTNGLRLPNERRILFERSESHDTLARAISGYLEIVNRYPNTRAAKDALYSAAVAHERLSNMNNYWRDIYGRGLFAGARHVTYQDVKSAYPRYQLPRGTNGWEASTRTVNGGPGWAPPAKPLPRETREHKIKRLLREFKDELSGASTKLSSAVQTKVEAGVASFGAMTEVALYGIVTGIGLWLLILVGANLHLGRRVGSLLLPRFDGPPEIESRLEALPPSESRVEKFLDS